MTEYTEIPQTLGEALIAEGNQAQADLLTEQGAALTREDILNIINNVSWGNLTDATLTSLRKISVLRIKSGHPVFPWGDPGFLNNINEDFQALVY